MLTRFLVVGRFAYKWRFLKKDQIRTKSVSCFTCGKACERDLFVSSIPWLSTKTIVFSSNNIHTVTLFSGHFLYCSLFDNARHIFKTLNDVTPLWKRSKDANAIETLRLSPPPPRRYDRGIHFLCKRKQVNSLLPRANWMDKFGPAPTLICPTHTVLPFLKLSTNLVIDKRNKGWKIIWR